MKQSIGPRSAQ